MEDMRKTKAALVEELNALRAKVQALEALKESEQKFRCLAESTTAQICIVQEDRYVYANQAFLDYYGLDTADLALLNPEDLMIGVMSKETIARIMKLWQAAVERGDSRIRFEFQDVDDNWFQSNVTMIQLGGKPAFMMMEFDITELKRAQNEMYRADKMAALGQIVAGVAHEINNPNNFIYFNLPILRKYLEAITPILDRQREADPDFCILGMPYAVFLEDVFKLLENMEHGSKRITGIVSDLKHYVRSDTEEERRPEQIGAIVKRVMTLAGKQVRKMVSRLDVEIATGLPAVEMNVGKIEQVLINLLINAGQAADKEDAWVKVSARAAAEGWVALIVEDNGVGIPKKNLERIFEPFFTSKGQELGTGLGLSIAHRIVLEHGGQIRVASKEGEGTAFKVLLPAAASGA